MFTGIIETLGKVKSVRNEGANSRFTFESEIAGELRVDQSVSHNGVCLTVVDIGEGTYDVVAVQETLIKSNLGTLRENDEVNIERSMLNNGRFDGHIVQGHVDQTGVVKGIKELDGSWLFEFEYDPARGNVTVEKGSIAINGVSLTCFNSATNGFSVAIIPFTYAHTNFRSLKVGNMVNLEFDVVGKYVKRMLNM